MTTHYGKRNPGALTAASPGDTLYIPLAFYNDSGASISIGNTLVAGDIEVFKNGSVTQRATDSGYAVLGDTGNFDNRVGLKGISISLFNTADDATFYAAGSTYWVAIDSVTVDGRTVRFWPAVFEIGEPRANVVALAGDTGAANRLFRYAQKLDTGGDATVSASVDTGQVNQAVWQANAQRKLTVDTGIADQVWMQTKASYTTDTGTFGEHLGGALGGSATVDTGVVNQAVWQANAARGITAIADTGMNERFARIQSDVDTGLRTHINDLDTGLHDTLSDYDTGMRALLALRDTGAIANAVWGFATRAVTNVTGFSDTGVNERLTAIEAQTAKLTFDTGNEILADIRKVNNVTVAGTGDTGAADTWRPA